MHVSVLVNSAICRCKLWQYLTKTSNRNDAKCGPIFAPAALIGFESCWIELSSSCDKANFNAEEVLCSKITLAISLACGLFPFRIADKALTEVNTVQVPGCRSLPMACIKCYYQFTSPLLVMQSPFHALCITHLHESLHTPG